MDEKQFKLENKPAACTQAPWKYLIPYEERESVMRQIRQECIDLYGYTFDECPKRMVCFAKQCIGRPLPWLSPTAKPYLEKLQETQNVKDGEMFIQTCAVCPIRLTCTSTCSQVNDYINRSQAKEPALIYKENTENIQPNEETGSVRLALLQGLEIPWDAISKRKQKVVRSYLYEQKDFKYIADTQKLNNQARAKYEFYSALNRLSEYAVVRAFLKKEYKKLTQKQALIMHEIYFNNNTVTKTAKKLNITKQAVSQIVNRVIASHTLKLQTFVRKTGNKVIYNVPGVMG
jgi:predicted DNA-binding protein YlxM (UPF0122 family)